MNQDQHIILDKELRRDIDAIIQKLKHSASQGCRSQNWRHSPERGAVIHYLTNAVMWLGMDLKAINDETQQDWYRESNDKTLQTDEGGRFFTTHTGDKVYAPLSAENPYPNSKDPSNTVIDPTADGLKL